MTDNQPIVSICCITYNHEKFIRDALEGFVKQQTSFPFEIVISDDCSEDSTRSIIAEYQNKYPSLIRDVSPEENIGLFSNFVKVQQEAKGKYLAFCEGDDYWTDPCKLQKQVDFLETHPDYSICFHRVQSLMHATGEIVDEYIVRDIPGESTIKDLAQGNYIHTPSVLLRVNRGVLERITSLGECIPGDYVTWMLYAETGKIWKIEEPMGVYRVGSGIWSSDLTIKSEVEMLTTLNKLWMVIEDKAVRMLLQSQIERQKLSVMEYVAHQQRDLDTILHSKAYRIGKALIAPFKWLKK